MKRKGALGGVVLIVVMVIAIIILALSTVKVPAGYVAVKYSLSGGTMDDVMTQGWHLKSPTVHTTLYTVGIEQSYLTAEDKGDSEKDESFSASSKEGKALQIDMTFTYRYKPETVAKVFTEFKGQSGKEVRDSFIKPNAISKTKEVIATYKVSDILGEKKAEVNSAITKYLADYFEQYGIEISNASLINIDVDDKTRDAINSKITAQQEAETQAINNQTAIDKATADAQVKKTQAQADADAKLIEAEAEAEANRKLRESLSDEVIKSQMIDKWNGELPKVSGASNGMIIDANDIVNDVDAGEGE